MDNFKMNDKVYEIDWSYEHLTFVDKKGKEVLAHYTFCNIFDIDKNFIMGDCSKSYNKFSKRFGRNVAFKRALLKNFNREERTEIWKQAKIDFVTKLLPDKKVEKKIVENNNTL